MPNHDPVERALPKKTRREATPAQRALGLLVRREHSRKELLAKLTARGVPDADAEQAVRRMAAEGWQDDGRFAASLARMRMAHGYGPVRIRAELGTHGLDTDAIAAVLTALAVDGEADWSMLAADLVRRRYGAAIATDPALRRKAGDFLIRRGFDGDCVRFAMRPRSED
ncbi:MAG: regulatory protein RecX [Luteimonas sp.]